MQEPRGDIPQQVSLTRRGPPQNVPEFIV